MNNDKNELAGLDIISNGAFLIEDYFSRRFKISRDSFAVIFEEKKLFMY